MIQSRRSKIILSIVVVLIVLPVFAFFLTRGNFCLAFLPAESRLAVQPSKELGGDHPALKNVAKRLALRSQPEESGDSERLTIKADVDGDGKTDRFTASASKLTLRLSQTGIKYRHRLFFQGKVASLGSDDVDGDGNRDLWYALRSKPRVYVIWGDSKGRFSGKQILDYTGSASVGGRAAFFDVNQDKQFELVLDDGVASSGPVQKVLYIEMKPAR